jgi:multiple sugar transport system substrate-binding protein
MAAYDRPVDMTRRRFLSGVLASLTVGGVATLVAACSASPTTPTSAPAAPTAAPAQPTAASAAQVAPTANAAAGAAPAALKGATIKGLFSSSPLDDEVLAQEAKDFEAATGIKAQFNTTGEDLFDKVATLVAARSPEYDVYHTHYAQIGRYLGGFEPLNDWAGRDGVAAKDFIVGSFDALTVKSKLLAIPNRFDLRSFYYRTDLFEKAGVKDPPKTWAELVDIGQKLTSAPDVYGYVTVGRGDPALREFSDLLWGAGGDFLENGLQPSKPVFNQAAGVEALQWWYDLIYTNKITFPGTSSYTWTELGGTFAGGQAAMSKQWNPGQFEDPKLSKIVGKYALAPLPTYKSARTTAVCHARAVNAFSKNKEAAWEFIKWEMSEDNLVKRSDKLGERPTRLSALEKVRVKAQGTRKQDIEAALARVNDGYTWPLFTEFNQIQPILWGEIEKVLSNQKKPKEALDFAATEAERILKEADLI